MVSRNYVIKYNKFPNIDFIEGILSNWLWEDDFTYSYFLRGLHIKNNICTYEAYYNEMLVGLITAWKSEYHQNCSYFSIVTKPQFGFEIESVLIKALLNFKEFKLPLQTSIWETSYKLKLFYEKSGFLEVRRTYMPSLRISKIDIDQVFPEFNGQDVYIKDISSISNNQKLKFKLIHLVRENYEKTHKVNPVAAQSFEKWEELIFNEETIQNGSYIVLGDNEILAYSLLHYSNTPNKFEFGWRGVNGNTDIRLMLLLTAYQINFAIENRVKCIKAEVDTTDYFSVEMLKFFPFSPAPSLLTFQKRANYELNPQRL